MTKVFPPYRLDSANACLWRQDLRIPLAPKVFAVLRYLVERPGRLVTQEELLHALWPDTYVQPEVLRKYILEIRRVLADPPKAPAFIETLPKRGYRSVAAVHDERGPARLVARPETERLVGRALDLATLARHLAAANSSQRQIVFVTGEAGIGKTSLVDAFQDEIATHNLLLARGQCVEGFGGKEAYYPVLEALGTLLLGPHAERLLHILATHAPTWLIQFPSAVKAEQRNAILQQTIGATRERMVREFCEATEALTADQPLVLTLEDLQWVDESTLDLISALARRRGPAKLLLLATYRPVEVILSRSPLKALKQDLLIHRLCHEIVLEPLTAAEVERYLAREFPNTDLAPVLAATVHRHSEGNPLFIVALLERLRQRGLLAQRDGKWVLTVLPAQLDPGVPETLQQMLELQLGLLSEPEQRLLRAASVAGQRFSAWAVSAITGLGVDQMEEVGEQLANHDQFIKRAGIQELADSSVAAQYEFKHALYREVLYRQLAPAQRVQFHLRLAERIEDFVRPPDPGLASELAQHFEAGRDYGRAIRYLLLSAGNAARRYAHADAIELLHHALGLLPHLRAANSREREIEILEQISHVLYAQGEMDQSAGIDARVAELAAQGGFKAAQVNALTRRARALAFTDPERCVALCERAVEVSRTHDDPLLQARAQMLMASWHIVANGWNPQDAAICEAARDTIAGLSSSLPAYYEILYAHVQFTHGDYEGACRTATAGIPKSIESDNLVVYFSAHSSLALALLHLGRWGELLRVLDRALEAAKENGNAPWLGIFRATRAWFHTLAGDLQSAGAEAEDLLRAYTEEPPGQVRTIALTTAGFVALEAGDAARALTYFQTVCYRELHPRFFFDWYWRSIARCGWIRAFLARGEVAKASQELEVLCRDAEGGTDPAVKAFAWELKARVAMAEQNHPLAQNCLQVAFNVEGALEVPFVAWFLHATMAALQQLLGNSRLAAQHRRSAEVVVLRVVDSFAEDEPLRKSLLDTPFALKIVGGHG